MESKQIAFINRQRDQARSIPLGPNKVTFLISAEDTDGSFSLTEFEAAPPPAPAAPLHVHHDAEETIYVLDGEFQVTCGDQVIPAHPGAAIFVPRGNPHTIANVGADRGRILVFLAPPGFEMYWNEMSRLMGSGPVDPEVALATQAKYHVDMLGGPRKFTER
jgi:quercetin dioxygenase-like cupin family protein